MRFMKRLLVIIPFILLGAAIVLLPIVNQEPDVLDVSGMEQQCDLACSTLVSEYRTVASDQTIWLSDFCTLNFDTSYFGGKFVDHCYSESDDILRRSCVLSKFDSTSLNINETVCG
jgi:hypothetical protein